MSYNNEGQDAPMPLADHNPVSEGEVLRYHGTPLPLTQTIAAHSWGVARLIVLLHPDPSAALLKAAINHDLAERWLGDMPAVAKWAHPELAAAYRDAEKRVEAANGYGVELDWTETRWLKACDMLELVMWCSHVAAETGSRTAHRIGSNGLAYLQEQQVWETLPAPVRDYVKETFL